jgi:hypothetical protein
MAAVLPAAAAANRPMTAEEKKVIFASSLGTVFEWYDFYLYGSLAAIIAKQFFSGLDPSSAFIFALLAFAAGFLVRPFGAIVFGRLGDMIGRKYTFLVTILIMGLSTFIVGLLPSYGSIGVAAPVILIALRMLQGLALGGEVRRCRDLRRRARAARQARRLHGVDPDHRDAGPVPVADRDPGHPHRHRRRGLRRLGLAHSLRGVRAAAGRVGVDPAVDERVARLPEDEGRGQDLQGAADRVLRPVEEPEDRHPGAGRPDAGQAVVWYSGQFYALFFLTQSLRRGQRHRQPDGGRGAGHRHAFFIVFGALSDKIGRKPIIMAGCLLAALTYFPVFGALTKAANPDLAAAQASAKVVVHADAAQCSFQGSPVAREIDFSSSCDIAKRYLAQNSVSYDNVGGEAGKPATITSRDKAIRRRRGRGNSKFDDDSTKKIAASRRSGRALKAAGYPPRPTRQDEQGHGDRDPDVPGDPGDHGLRPDRRDAGGAVPDAHPLHLDEPAVPHRQRLVRRPAAHHGLRHRRADRQHVQRPLVPDHHRRATFVIGTLFIRETKDVDIYARD